MKPSAPLSGDPGVDLPVDDPGVGLAVDAPGSAADAQRDAASGFAGIGRDLADVGFFQRADELLVLLHAQLETAILLERPGRLRLGDLIEPGHRCTPRVVLSHRLVN